MDNKQKYKNYNANILHILGPNPHHSQLSLGFIDDIALAAGAKSFNEANPKLANMMKKSGGIGKQPSSTLQEKKHNTTNPKRTVPPHTHRERSPSSQYLICLTQSDALVDMKGMLCFCYGRGSHRWCVVFASSESM
jgi:hypothetical protein